MPRQMTLHTEAIDRVTIGPWLALRVVRAEQALDIGRALLTARALAKVVARASTLFIALSTLDGGFSEAARGGHESDDEENQVTHGVACIRERNRGQA
tara:strand:+ start:141 stop:434 length:294 start_codon:yes stop_codon:yes gene_type:complete